MIAHTLPLEHIAWPSRQVPAPQLLAQGGGDLELFIHLTPEANPMSRFVIGFGACPRWRQQGHRAGDELLLTLWLTPTTARCAACNYLEPLADWMARMGWERPE